MTFDLVPGRITTREEVAASYGGSVYSGGMVPAPKSKMVFVYSDPAAGEKHGYTFDGWAEDDEYGPLYLYTGAGAEGHQQMVRGNKVLMDTLTNGYAVHLFVSNGKAPGKKLVMQRYVGRVVLDAVEPYEERWAPGSDGVMRRVFVFRLRPAEGATMNVTDTDTVLPAAQTTIVELPQKPPAVKVPAQQTGAKSKKTEQHTTAQTTANIPGGPRTVLRREGQLCTAFEAFLLAAGHKTKSFQITVKGEPGTFTPDLYDATDNVLYEAKGIATRNNVRMAIGQLLDYRRHLEVPDGLRLAVLLPQEPTSDVRALCEAENIALVTQTTDGFAGFPLPSAST
ncbi:hypothetical protein PV729_25890 [Streptomyces europaeiscabiei]|uniref:ScoMcrA-like SRA domain-containing protein n=1 Tax=Streptomyces europaeiscabiei TaxID=146819 RepID=A0ABU4NSV3_9ACTN|nr:hypothetical protein [Streptomyces europaeiscabiei]MDX3548793.1 hypothetical protein [Streptomyces europaeiscabiei]MDX3555153.1 hypothetical protein [Streptomyces europaeiscabiei]MDX3705167.1 hypothetical protein [Streptomyces europaeiscabiei]